MSLIPMLVPLPFSRPPSPAPDLPAAAAMTSTPPSSHHSHSGQATPFSGSPASSRVGELPSKQPPAAAQQQQPDPDSFGGDWSVWGATLPQVSYKRQQDPSGASPAGENGYPSGHGNRFDPNAPPFLYSPTYLPQQDGFAPYAMQAPLPDGFNPYDPNSASAYGPAGPGSPYSPTAQSFSPQSPAMPLGQMPYGSYDANNPNPAFWMMSSPAQSAASLPGQEYNPGRRQSRDAGVQYARGYADSPPFRSGYGTGAYGHHTVPTGPAGMRSPSFGFQQQHQQQRRLSHSGWPQFNAPGFAAGRRNNSVGGAGGKIGLRMPGGGQPGGAPSFGAGKRGSVDSTYAPVLRSETLEDFRSDKTRLWELAEIRGHVVEFTSDQFASRWLQQKLETASEDERQWVFDEAMTAAFAIQTDVFGNYCIQKLFDYGTPEQREALAKTMEGFVLPLSLSTYGCRSIQKALEVVSVEQRSALVSELKDNIMDCVKSSNANHVIQRIVALPSPGLNFVEAFTGRVFELSTHPYGCRVLQRCFEFLPEDQARPLLTEMHAHTRRLVLDQFGNYVIQFVIEKGQPEDRTRIIAEMKTQIYQMARHKFASNVCEKALVCAPREEREMLIDELLLKPEGSVALLMKDQFGNYVLQRSLRVSEGAQKEALKARVRPFLEQMRLNTTQPYSKHLAAIERLLSDEPIAPAAAAEPSSTIVPPVVSNLAAATKSAPSSRPASAAGVSAPPSLAASSRSSGASSPVPTPSQSSERSPEGQPKI